MIRILGTLVFSLIFLATLPFALLSPMIADNPNGATEPAATIFTFVVIGFWAFSLSFLVAAIGTWRRRGHVSLAVLTPLIPLIMLGIAEYLYEASYHKCLMTAC